LRYLQVDAGAYALDRSQYSWNKTISHMLSTMAALSDFTTQVIEAKDVPSGSRFKGSGHRR
jgi:hypothetical protein